MLRLLAAVRQAPRFPKPVRWCAHMPDTSGCRLGTPIGSFIQTHTAYSTRGQETVDPSDEP